MFRLNTFKTVLHTTAFGLLVSCSKDKNSDTPILQIKTYSNLSAPQINGASGQPSSGPFTKFSFSANSTVTGDNWDIAFRGTTIVVNGGTSIGITDEPSRSGKAAISIVNNTLDAVKIIPDANTFKQDGPNSYAIPTGSGNGWYNYNSTNNLITAIAGKVFVVKTHDGKYAKFEIISYYKDAPTNPDPSTAVARYYTFSYVYQPNGTSL